jgi:hypothetical protein
MSEVIEVRQCPTHQVPWVEICADWRAVRTHLTKLDRLEAGDLANEKGSYDAHLYMISRESFLYIDKILRAYYLRNRASWPASAATGVGGEGVGEKEGGQGIHGLGMTLRLLAKHCHLTGDDMIFVQGIEVGDSW